MAGAVSPSPEGVVWRGAARQTGDFLLPDSGHDQATQRLKSGLDRFRRTGAVIDGEVGSSNVLHAIRDALRERDFDEIILSTLPSGASRWLRQDLPHRVQRDLRLPVTVITPPEA